MLKELVEAQRAMSQRLGQLESGQANQWNRPAPRASYKDVSADYEPRQDRQQGPQSYNPRHMPGNGQNRGNQSAAYVPPPARQARTTAANMQKHEEQDPFAPHPLI